VAEYAIFVLCIACGDLHPMGISVMLEDGPSAKESIAKSYAGKDLPSTLAGLKNKRVYCPKTGRQYSQNDNNKVFLVPVGESP
jgi:hypothetical protein